MSSWIALSRTEHASKHWRPRNGFQFAGTEQVVPLTISELSKILPHYATGFVSAENGSFQYVAIVGVDGNRNVYVTRDSKWLCGYVPANLRAYPFAVLNDVSGNKVFCLDEAYLSDDIKLPRLFQDNGDLEKSVADTLDFVDRLEHSRILTEKACLALAKADLMTEWPITIKVNGEKSSYSLKGVYRINEEKLNTLSADSLEILRNAGAMPLAYAQLFSIAQIEQLTLRAKYCVKEDSRDLQSAGLGDLFNVEHSGTLNFDAFDTASYDKDDK